MPYLSKPKLLLTFLLALAASCALSQQPNPFRSIGKKADVIDISQGRYVEIIEKDSVERIGSVVVNRYTRKIERLFDETQIDTETDNTAQSRFFSVDPLARQFPELSPYQFAGNTPIQAIDLDGSEPQGFMEYWKVKTEYHTKWNFTVQDVYDYKTKQTWTVMHYPNTNDYYYWQTKYEGANKLFVPQNTSLNRQENQWTGLFKQFTPTHLSEDRSFHYAMVGMMASPFVAMGIVEGGAAAWYGIEAQALKTIGNAALKYWAHAPAIGKAGMNVAEFLDESGSVGAQNSGVTFRATEVLTSSFRHIFSSKHLKKGLEVFGNSDGEILRKVESIIKSNIKNLKEGDNFIETTINGVKGTVKAFVEKSDIKSVNAVKGEYERKYNNVIQDINSN